MHENSIELMKSFISICLDPLNPKEKLTILDVGSYDINGSYRELFIRPNWEYTGADISSGKNVDIVFKSPYDWGDKQYDVVISGQCIEHCEDIKEWALQLKKLLDGEDTLVLLLLMECMNIVAQLIVGGFILME